MPIIPPPPGDSGPRRSTIPLERRSAVPAVLALLLFVPLIVVLVGAYVWFAQRVEVPADKVLVLVKRMGETLPVTTPDGQPLPESVREQVVLYPALLKALGEPEDSTRYKGVMYKALGPGRYFYDPFIWERRIFPAVDIAQDEVGLLIRQYGRPLAPGKIVATEPDERGPLADPLLPDRYHINPFAYQVRKIKQVVVPPGSHGVQTLRHGAEPTNPNVWVVQQGEHGVQPDVLSPGRYPINPYVRKVDIVDTRTHTLDLRGDDAIRFPSKDSFEIVMETTVQYKIAQDRAPYVLMAIGDYQDVESKLILPFVRSLARIEGSKLLAREFISGEDRKKLENTVYEGLRTQCAEQGIAVEAMLIRRINPPDAIANPISDRQIAEQQIKQYRSEIEVAIEDANLAIKDRMVDRAEAVEKANTAVIGVIKEAERDKTVALTEAQQRLAVAKLELEAARAQAEALLSRGRADADVVLLQFEAEAKPLAEAVAAFGGGETYAQFFFYQKLSPSLRSILDSTDGPFADIFRSLSTSGAVEEGTR